MVGFSWVVNPVSLGARTFTASALPTLRVPPPTRVSGAPRKGGLYVTASLLPDSRSCAWMGMQMTAAAAVAVPRKIANERFMSRPLWVPGTNLSVYACLQLYNYL